jgi:hypothetical protein
MAAGQDHHPTPHVRISGSDGQSTWWVAPLVILLVAIALIVAAVVIVGPGIDSSSPAANGTATTPSGLSPGP